MLNLESSDSAHSRTAESNARGYQAIIKATGLIAGSQIAVLLLSLLRMKAMAVLVGPSGIGILGIYRNLQQMTNSVVGLGMQTSGVRELASQAESDGPDDPRRLILALKQFHLLSGILGSIGIILAARQISFWTTGSEEFSFGIRIVGVAVFFMALTSFNHSVLEGQRKLRELARSNICSAAVGSPFAVAGCFYFGQGGIAVAVVSLAISSFLVSGFFSDTLGTNHWVHSWYSSVAILRRIIWLGVASMCSAFLPVAAMYVARTIIARKSGLDDVGLYVASYTLAGLFVGIILQAMTADFFPRLSAVANEPEAATTLINRQVDIGLLVVFPACLLVICFSEELLNLLYSAEFANGARLLVWFSLGSIARVLHWPLGYAFLAKQRASVHLLNETIGNVAHLVLVYLLIVSYGLIGTGLAFAIYHLLYASCCSLVARVVIGFHWERKTILLVCFMLPIALGSLWISGRPSSPVIFAAKITIVLLALVWSARAMAIRLGLTSLAKPGVWLESLKRSVMPGSGSESND